MKLNRSLKKHVKGFTLIEVAIVMLIIAFLIGAAITPLKAQRESANIKKARAELKTIEEALYGFAIANDRLPCPTQPGFAGVESNVGGDCNNNSRGFIPANTLGINGQANCDGLLIDPWNNPYRYSVATTNIAGMPTRDFTTTGDIKAVRDTLPVGLNKLLPNIRICGENTCAAANVLASNTVAVIYSMGGNWNNVVSADETQNAGENTIASGCGLAAYGVDANNDYVSRSRVETVGNEYDDILVWISPNILYSRLLKAGLL